MLTIQEVNIPAAEICCEGVCRPMCHVGMVFSCITFLYIRRPAGVSDWKVLFLFLACTCSFVLLLRAFASSELSAPLLSIIYYVICVLYL